jgi:hypothetical protein
MNNKMQRDFSDLDLDQLVSVFDNLGRYASDFKNSVSCEIVARLFTSVIPVECTLPTQDAEIQEWAKFKRIAERVNNHPSYIKALRSVEEEAQKRITQP